jgi:hypothetical protein
VLGPKTDEASEQFMIQEHNKRLPDAGCTICHPLQCCIVKDSEMQNVQCAGRVPGCKKQKKIYIAMLLENFLEIDHYENRELSERMSLKWMLGKF